MSSKERKFSVVNIKKARPINRAELKERFYRKRFLAPNAVTIGSMFCGFLTTVYAATGRFEKACIAIALAILLDGLDGRVARKLNATSRFGVEFDSLSDLISFGVAPATLMYYWCFQKAADEFGVFVTFIYVICAASRLARFNISDSNLKAFTGLPTPGAAAFIAALVNFSPTLHESIFMVVFGALLVVSLSYLMVSKIEFFSIKMLTIRGMSSKLRIAIGATIALTWYNSGIAFLVLSSLYILSGPLSLVRSHRIDEI